MIFEIKCRTANCCIVLNRAEKKSQSILLGTFFFLIFPQFSTLSDSDGVAVYDVINLAEHISKTKDIKGLCISTYLYSKREKCRKYEWSAWCVGGWEMI